MSQFFLLLWQEYFSCCCCLTFSFPEIFQEQLSSVEAFFHLTKFSVCLLTGNHMYFSCIIFKYVFKEGHKISCLFLQQFPVKCILIVLHGFSMWKDQEQRNCLCYGSFVLITGIFFLILFLVKCILIVLHGFTMKFPVTHF